MHPSLENFIPWLFARREEKSWERKNTGETIGDITTIAPPAILGQHVRRFHPFPPPPNRSFLLDSNHWNPCRLLEASGYSLCANNYKGDRSLTYINAETWSRKSTGKRDTPFPVNTLPYLRCLSTFLLTASLRDTPNSPFARFRMDL